MVVVVSSPGSIGGNLGVNLEYVRRSMKQHYFVVVLAHSLHGRLRRIHVPHQALYVVLGLALLGGFSLFGMVSSYLRMTWKVSNYNSLRDEVNILRARYQELQRQNDEKGEQLVSL